VPPAITSGKLTTELTTNSGLPELSAMPEIVSGQSPVLEIWRSMLFWLPRHTSPKLPPFSSTVATVEPRTLAVTVMLPGLIRVGRW